MTGEWTAVLLHQPEMAFFLMPAIGHAGSPQLFASLDAKGLRLGPLCMVEVVVPLAGLLAHHAQ